MVYIPGIDCRRLKQYCELNCDSIRKYLEQDDFRKLITIDNHYRVTVQHTLALFDFSNEPIDGKYKSLIIDMKWHFILTCQSTKAIINSIYKNIALAGQIFQRRLAEQMNHKYLNVISLGHSAFFSLKGYSNGNTHWVALHHIKDYKHHENKIHFRTFELGSVRFRFAYEAKAHVHQRLHNSIEHNKAIRVALGEHLINNLGLTHTPIRYTKRSVLYHCRHTITPINIRELVEGLLHFYIIKTHKYTRESEEFYTTFSNICRKLTRDRYTH